MEYTLELRDGRVRIRPFQAGDNPTVLEAISESFPELDRWLPDLVMGGDAGTVSAQSVVPADDWTATAAYHFAIVDSQDQTFLGGAGLTDVQPMRRLANLYYWVRSSRVCHGVASEPILLVARFAFDTLALKRVELVVAVDNHASIRVAEKVGAVREGVIRHHLLLHTQLHDAVVFSLLPRMLAR